MATAEYLIAIDNDSMKNEFMELLAMMDQSFTRMLVSVRKYRLLSTKRGKLWVLFHKFSITDGSDMCNKCDKALNLNAHETFWQLLMDT